MSDLMFRGGGQRRVSHAQIREMKRQMKLAQRKLQGMQQLIDEQELQDKIIAESLLNSEINRIETQYT